MIDIEATAATLLAARDAHRTLACPSAAHPDLDLPAAYRIAAELTRLRAVRGERPVGRKIGFTNARLWADYGIGAPIWGEMYDTTVAPIPESFAVAALTEPRIEPELALRLAAPPRPGMDAEALMACVSHVAHGFEIVQSPFPGWRFAAADAVAAFGLHAAFLHGPFVPVGPDERALWAERLAACRLVLERDGAEVDGGTGAAVLGAGPLAALAHLAALVAADPHARPLAAGEIVTTGSLTSAPAVAPGETWTTALEGLPLPGLRLRLV